MVSWDFIEEALEGYGFPASFTQRVMTCITSTRFSIKVNGIGYGYFAWKRGLSQEDPISPLFFVLVIEYLSRKMCELSDFKLHAMCKILKLTHLTFVDGLMIFCKDNSASVTRVMEGFKAF